MWSVFLSFIIKSFTHECFSQVKSSLIFCDSQKPYCIDCLTKPQCQIILLLFLNVTDLKGVLLSRLTKSLLGLFFLAWFTSVFPLPADKIPYSTVELFAEEKNNDAATA